MIPNPGLDILYFPRSKVQVEPKYERKTPTWVINIRSRSFYYITPKLFKSTWRYERASKYNKNNGAKCYAVQG